MKENSLDQIKNIFLESNKTKLAIIGKGASIQEVQLDLLKEEYFIIGLNDAESFVPVDLSIFYKEDVWAAIEKKGANARFYMAPENIDIPSDIHVVTRYVSLDQEGLDKIFSYFYNDEYYILDFTLLSAMKLALLFQSVKNIGIDAVFLGFDFYMDQVREDDLQGLEYRNAHLRTQESIFITLLKDLGAKFPLIEFKHIGNKKYSSASVEEFNRSLTDTVFIGRPLPTNSENYKKLLEEIDNSTKVIVVAELTNNHIGDKQRLLKMIELATQSGADMIKVQKRDVDHFYTEGELASPYSSPFGDTLGDYRRGVELTPELFDILDIECRKRGIPWFASVLDWNSYLYMKELDCPVIKLPSTISNHKNYLKRVAEDFDGELVVSTGFTDERYEKFVLNNLVKNKKLFLLQCTSSYPTPPEACQISVVRHYELLRKDYPNIIPGYSSHDIGSLGCQMAVAAGARMIEKHVKLGDLDWVHFDSVAIDLYNNHFASFVKDIRLAELMSGTMRKSIHAFEHHKYKVNEKAN